MPTAIFVFDIPVKAETNNDDDQNQHPHENLHNERSTIPKVKIETTDDQNDQHSHESLCNNGQTTTIIRAEDDIQVQPTSKAGNKKKVVKSRSERWDEMFELLQQCKTEHGDVDIPTPYVINPKLGHWVSHQRTGYRHYKSGNKQKSKGMGEERRKKLESIGFIWVSKFASKKQTVWDEMFEQLKLFKPKCAHQNISIPYADNPKLGRWVNVQQRGYKNYKLGNKRRSHGMCEERIKKLERMHFHWTANSEYASKIQTWHGMFEVLKLAKAKNAHKKVSNPYEDNPKLRKWVSYQCQGYTSYKNGIKDKCFGMSEERIDNTLILCNRTFVRKMLVFDNIILS